MAELCDHYHVGPADIRTATMEEIGALVRRMRAVQKAVEAARGR
jgi:hypothetical protein